MNSAQAQDIQESTSPLIEKIVAAKAGAKDRAVRKFWGNIDKNGTPLIESGSGPDMMRLTFILPKNISNQASAMSASVAMMRTENPFVKFKNVSGTNIWYQTWEMPRTSRGMYWLVWPRGKLANDNAVWAMPGRDGLFYEFFTDPSSRLSLRGGMDNNFADKTTSVFEGDRAGKEFYVNPQDNIQRGTLVTKTIESATLEGTRTLSIYHPANMDRQCQYKWVLFFDAEQYLSFISTQTILDNMIADDQIDPVISVFLHSGATRLIDLPPNNRMKQFITQELIPWIQKEEPVSHAREDATIVGFSHGGLAAMNAALSNQSVFGRVLLQSGSFWWAPNLGRLDPSGPYPINANSTARRIADELTSPLKAYIEVGKWEGNYQIGSSRHLRDVLKAGGNDVTYTEYTGAHDYAAWRGQFPNALKEILGTKSAAHLSCATE